MSMMAFAFEDMDLLAIYNRIFLSSVLLSGTFISGILGYIGAGVIYKDLGGGE